MAAPVPLCSAPFCARSSSVVIASVPQAPKPSPKTPVEVPPPPHMESTLKPSVAAQRDEHKATGPWAGPHALRGPPLGSLAVKCPGLLLGCESGSQTRSPMKSPPPRKSRDGDGVGGHWPRVSLGKGVFP